MWADLYQADFADNAKLQIIDEQAFRQTNISEITIPSQVTCIGYSAFELYQSLQHVNIPFDSKLEIVGEEAFFDTMITSITLSSQLREFCFPRVLSLKNNYHKR